MIILVFFTTLINCFNTELKNYLKNKKGATFGDLLQNKMALLLFFIGLTMVMFFATLGRRYMPALINIMNFLMELSFK